jgi:hypothetical protein
MTGTPNDAFLRTFSSLSDAWLYKIRYLITIVFCLTISPKIGTDIFLLFPRCLFHCTYMVFKFYVQLTLYLRSNKHPIFDFSITYPGKLIFHMHKSSAILIHCLDRIFVWVQVWCAVEVNKFFSELINKVSTTFSCPGISDCNLWRQSLSPY